MSEQQQQHQQQMIKRQKSAPVEGTVLRPKKGFFRSKDNSGSNNSNTKEKSKKAKIKSEGTRPDSPKSDHIASQNEVPNPHYSHADASL